MTTNLGLFGFSSGVLKTVREIIVPETVYEITGLTPAIITGANILVPETVISVVHAGTTMGTGATVHSPSTDFELNGFAPRVGSGSSSLLPNNIIELNGFAPRVGSGSNIEIEETVFNLTGLTPAYVGQEIINEIIIPDNVVELNSFAPRVGAGVNIQTPDNVIELIHGISYYKIRLIKFTGDYIPEAHVIDSKKLDADAYVDLFQISLSGTATSIYLKMDNDVDWQGHTYEGTGIKIEGVGVYADDEVARPKLTIFNPEGIYNYLVDQGFLEGATVIRYRVLKEHIDDDIPVYRKQQWKVSRVASLKVGFIGLELRDMLDGQNFLTPGRMFIPPEFSAVSLQ